MSKKIKIALLMGGSSSERKISLKTGQQVLRYLDKNKYQVEKYDPQKDLGKILRDAKNKKIDLAFIALHGKFGEDGRIQGMLDMLRIPYTGSGTLASSLCMDKIASKQIIQQNKIPTPPFFYVSNDELKQNGEKIFSKIKLPMVIKPNDSGSSLGVTIVKHTSQIKKACRQALKESKYILIEKYIPGLELTIPILGDKALPVIEVVPKTGFFDYKAKYIPACCDEIVPAKIPYKITQKAQNLSLKTHQILMCEGYSRVDLILDKKNTLQILEVNTLPGMTANSLLPKSAKAAGIDFSQLLDKIVELGLNKIT